MDQDADDDDHSQQPADEEEGILSDFDVVVNGWFRLIDKNPNVDQGTVQEYIELTIDLVRTLVNNPVTYADRHYGQIFGLC
jgi:hypothetical protein